jgi:hypothetical protein
MVKTLVYYIIVIGLITAAVLTSMGKIPFLGHLPGDTGFSVGRMEVKVPFTTIGVFFIALVILYKLFSSKK